MEKLVFDEKLNYSSKKFTIYSKYTPFLHFCSYTRPTPLDLYAGLIGHICQPNLMYTPPGPIGHACHLHWKSFMVISFSKNQMIFVHTSLTSFISVYESLFCVNVNAL